jgi:hypothetical protein
MEKDFVDWVYRTTQVSVRANETLKLYAGPEVSPAEFRTRCAVAAREGRDAEFEKAEASYNKQISTLEGKMGREQRELSKDQSDLSERRMEELGTHAENIASLFSKRWRYRILSSSLSKRRLTEHAKAEVEESKETIEELQARLQALEEEKDSALQEINERWGRIAAEVSEISVTPLKKDVLLDLFGVAWLPYHVVQVGSEIVELPGYAGRE